MTFELLKVLIKIYWYFIGDIVEFHLVAHANILTQICGDGVDGLLFSSAAGEFIL